MVAEDRGKRVRVARLLALIMAGVLLNVGLYSILWFVTPFVAGAVVGYLLVKLEDAVAGSSIGAILAYIPLFMLTSNLSGQQADFVAIGVAALLMAAIAILGGILGNTIQRRSLQARPPDRMVG